MRRWVPGISGLAGVCGIRTAKDIVQFPGEIYGQNDIKIEKKNNQEDIDLWQKEVDSRAEVCRAIWRI